MAMHLAVPEPSSLVQVNDQCSSIEAWADQCESIPELQDAGNKLAAIDEYINRTSTEGRARVAAAMRRLEVRIGKLLAPAVVGAHSSVSEGEALTPNQRHQFRQMAEHEDVVETAIAESTDEAPASRRRVLDRVGEARERLAKQEQRLGDLLGMREQLKDEIAAGRADREPPLPTTEPPWLIQLQDLAADLERLNLSRSNPAWHHAARQAFGRIATALARHQEAIG